LSPPLEAGADAARRSDRLDFLAQLAAAEPEQRAGDAAGAAEFPWGALVEELRALRERVAAGERRLDMAQATIHELRRRLRHLERERSGD
jgi:hypothetical protein